MDRLRFFSYAAPPLILLLTTISLIALSLFLPQISPLSALFVFVAALTHLCLHRQVALTARRRPYALGAYPG